MLLGSIGRLLNIAARRLAHLFGGERRRACARVPRRPAARHATRTPRLSARQQRRTCEAAARARRVVWLWRSLLRLRRSVYGGEHRRELDDRLDFDLVSLEAAHGPAGKVCRTVVREHLEVRARVICRGRRVWGGPENAQNANLNVARDTRTLTLIGIGRPNGLVELGREELEYR